MQQSHQWIRTGRRWNLRQRRPRLATSGRMRSVRCYTRHRTRCHACCRPLPAAPAACLPPLLPPLQPPGLARWRSAPCNDAAPSTGPPASGPRKSCAAAALAPGSRSVAGDRGTGSGAGRALPGGSAVGCTRRVKRHWMCMREWPACADAAWGTVSPGGEAWALRLRWRHEPALLSVSMAVRAQPGALSRPCPHTCMPMFSMPSSRKVSTTDTGSSSQPR